MVIYQREKWRGKQYVVVRSSKGRVLSRRRWQRSFTVEDGRKKYNKDRSLQEGTHVEVDINQTTRTVELTKWGDRTKGKAKSPTRMSGNVQYVVEVKFRHPDTGRAMTVFGRSNKGVISSTELKAQARERAYQRVHQESVGGYDEDVGQRIAEENIISTREGWIKYTGPSYSGGVRA